MYRFVEDHCLLQETLQSVSLCTRNPSISKHHSQGVSVRNTFQYRNRSSSVVHFSSSPSHKGQIIERTAITAYLSYEESEVMWMGMGMRMWMWKVVHNNKLFEQESEEEKAFDREDRKRRGGREGDRKPQESRLRLSEWITQSGERKPDDACVVDQGCCE
ncbi:uncharacterized protein BO66DRAFT_169677 [Aspergillus aculeatinus CBS 121060]|uniref:Uncharacterized protein n=1 Tax=Aspergillus aculeatinus CBS 121060 TaxID=1448322 RepID=A0ACD1GZW1_9EURO|nr:hypothetical protein BO66DRAFT_169677 [Aspergillus aculeatinus CBS 121060]RAH66678.1 hypothetical protein BO66DRAFT_169677 [Aspergillus aculeatinus CBS 121060]